MFLTVRSIRTAVPLPGSWDVGAFVMLLVSEGGRSHRVREAFALIGWKSLLFGRIIVPTSSTAFVLEAAKVSTVVPFPAAVRVVPVGVVSVAVAMATVAVVPVVAVV